MRTLIPLLSAILLASCGPYPRDIDGTFDRVTASTIIRVGIVSADDDPRHRAIVARYLSALQAATGARASLRGAAAEPLLAALEEGALDLVIGEFAKDTPWLPDVAVIEPLAERRMGKRTMRLAPVARNGENRWIMLLEKTVRDGRGG